MASDFNFRVYRRKPYLTAHSHKKYPGVEFVDLPSTRLKGVEALVHTFLCVMHLLFNRVDAVNVHNIGPGMFIPLLRLMGYPVVLTYHSPNYEHDKWGTVSKAILRLSEKLSLGFASHTIFVSPFQQAKYSERVQQRSSVVPNGINRLEPTKSIDFLTHHGVEPGGYILSVGRITPEKGFSYLIEAVQELDSVKQLVIAGSSDHNPNAISKLKELDRKGKVVFTGYTSGTDLTQLYANAAAYVLPSLAEGFPMVLLEAMSFGLPIAASDIPAAHIIELPNSHYAPPGDAPSLARAIEAALSGPARHSYPLDRYNWDHIAHRTVKIYRSLLKN
ncbi:MAG: glycosyltransferase family 4 protein [Firmicutes bacterium]|nr:glycosyltransferase family 4 protein [Bacillota bacterium]MCM1401223.1 glycosyltransferase family 4 protein [Bacteroides sp.]MCM1477228.1 glycosyltransferase family 4 protein [Bacteroides sp.]